MRIVSIIPARMASSRFPGKPLARIVGLPMIEHVYKRASACRALDEVYIATCDQEIVEVGERIGARVLMTATSHERASDRVAEAAEDLEADIIVMVQGDEPMIVPQMIDLALEPLLNDVRVVCSNLTRVIESEEEFEDRNTIKVVMNKNGDAVYFSREPIPTRKGRSFAELATYKQVCVIPFRKEFLLRFASLESTPLEQVESIDMLRALEHGVPIRMVKTDVATYAVDTREDLRRVEVLLQNDPLLKTYRVEG